MDTQSGLHRAPDDTFNHRTLLKEIDFSWKKFLVKKRNLGSLWDIEDRRQRTRL